MFMNDMFINDVGAVSKHNIDDPVALTISTGKSDTTAVQSTSRHFSVRTLS